MFRHTSEFHRWFSEQGRTHAYQVTPTPLDRLDGWDLDPDTGALRHQSGRFFSIDGLAVTTDHREVTSWAQPIIDQPEVGILGILVKRFDGVPHLLMQAKMEPGNRNLLQLSPTVQATRSNYTRVHQGNAVPYLAHFVAPRPGRVLFDALQSEQGAWFLCKRNRNMIVEVEEDVPVLDGFCWLTLEQVGELLGVENLVNMDSRTVLAGLPPMEPGLVPATAGTGSFREAVAGSSRPGARAMHDLTGLLSWFAEVKAARQLERTRIPLSQAKGWIRSSERVSHESGRYFSVIGVNVKADSREVGSWSQPMIAPSGRGVVAFLARRVEGVLHLLVKAHTEAGTRDLAEIGPTLKCAPGNYEHLPAHRRPAFWDDVLCAPPERVRLDVVHSEEGGRFYHAENRYLVVEAAGDFPLEVPHDFTWMTVRQLMGMVRYSNHVNVEARNLLADLRLMP